MAARGPRAAVEVAAGSLKMNKDYLVLKRASASRSSGEWNDDDFDVLADGVVVDRIMEVLGQTVVSTGAYIVQGGTKAPAARYIWSLYFGLERVTMIRGFLHQALVMKATRRLVAKLVVVIDDDPLILEATEGLLRSWGCCVVAARSCDEALVRLAETEAGRRPDVIVCDYQLSRGMTGVDAIERLRSAFPISALPPIPALLISGDASSLRCEVGSRSYHFLYKPVNAERFHAALVDASVLRRAGPAEALENAFR